MNFIPRPHANACLALFVFLPFLSLTAQSYNTCLGLRWGDGMGMTLRQRVLKKASLEGLYYRDAQRDHSLAGVIFDMHMPVLTKRLNLYAGGGFGVIMPEELDSPVSSSNAFLVNTGIEITLGRINLSWDFMPVIPIGQETPSTLYPLSAFSLRYVLIKKEKKGLFRDVFEKNKHQKGGSKAKRKRRGNR